ncbi:MAG: DUF429 domain-containing protein [Thermodesulfobacteriota bacterium]|nr:DUF429 domain-containing protein [Thermodesulfobacteriota bacterium]
MNTIAKPPVSGVVLGIDVGFSAKSATTGLCLLSWDTNSMKISFVRTRTGSVDRRRDIRALVGSAQLLAVAIDGPLVRGLQRISHYRAAEALLSRSVLQKRGKPGQTNSPVGQQLHAHATELAEIVLTECAVDAAAHYQAIHERCIVEAFPNMFLAAGVPEAELPSLRRNASDAYWRGLVVQSGRLLQLMGSLLPGRKPSCELCTFINHEDRAAFVCALSALSVLSQRHVAVGDPYDGDIILPPRIWWGKASIGTNPWMEVVLRDNLASVRRSRNGSKHHGDARVVLHAGEWQL